jgi:hypothetical protein
MTAQRMNAKSKMKKFKLIVLVVSSVLVVAKC